MWIDEIIWRHLEKEKKRAESRGLTSGNGAGQSIEETEARKETEQELSGR